MRGNLINGKTHDEKFASIERTLQHIMKRANKAVGVYIPPTLLSVHVVNALDGIIHKQLFPVSGVLRDVCCMIEELPEKMASVMLEIYLRYPDGKGEKVLIPGKKSIQSTLNTKFEKRIPASFIQQGSSP